MSTEKQVRIKQRVDTAKNWKDKNPILLKGEIGFESDTKNYKIGDGIRTWTQLDYGGIGWATTINGAEIFNDTGNVAIGSYSHAEGYGSVALYPYSHVEGISCTVAGNAAHAGGKDSAAASNYSFAHGLGVIAQSEAQTVIGKYNVQHSEAAFIIGNGTDSTDLSDAVVIDWNGNIEVATETTSESTPNTLTTKSYVDSKENYKIGDTLTTYRKDLDDSWRLCNGQLIDEETYPELYNNIKQTYNYPFNNRNLGVGYPVLKTLDKNLNIAVAKNKSYIYILVKGNTEVEDLSLILIELTTQQVHYYPTFATLSRASSVTAAAVINNDLYFAICSKVYKVTNPIINGSEPKAENIFELTISNSTIRDIIVTNSNIIVNVTSSSISSISIYYIGNIATPLEEILNSSDISANLSTLIQYKGYLSAPNQLIFYDSRSSFNNFYYITPEDFINQLNESPSNLYSVLRENQTAAAPGSLDFRINCYEDRLRISDYHELEFYKTSENTVSYTFNTLPNLTYFYSPTHNKYLYCNSQKSSRGDYIYLSNDTVLDTLEAEYQIYRYLSNNCYLVTDYDTSTGDAGTIFIGFAATQLPITPNTYIKIK